MQIGKKKLSELIPAVYNPRKIAKRELEKLKNSIKEFGYVEPVIWNKRTGVVVGGHQRLKVLKEQGFEEIECVIVDLPEEKEKALNVALNKISGEWQPDKLTELFKDLELNNVDLSFTGFDDYEINNLFKDEEFGYYGDERNKTFDLYRLDVYDETRIAGHYNFPTLEPCHYIPDDLIAFNYVRSCKESDYAKGVHFFIDDYQFERIWNRPRENVELLKKFACVITPDFSTYENMPKAMKIWNMYRMRVMGQMWQDEGIQVIPHIRLIDFDGKDFEESFAGLPKGGVIADSTVGISKRNYKENMAIFKKEMDYAIEKLSPDCVIIYGSKPDYDFGNTKVKFIAVRSWS